jgi:DNA-binding response OmpR family regulator
MAEKTTVLIVDKEKIIVDLLVRVWSSKEISILGSTSADEALKIVQVRTPNLLIVDPSIPNAFTLISAAQTAVGARTKVIALASTPELRTRANAVGVDVVDRTRGIDALADAIQKALNMKLKFLEPVSEHVMIVDDEEGIRELLREFLVSRGYTVSVAKNGRDGLERVKSDPTIQIVLLDILMPDMSGMNVLIEIMRTAVRPSVIMMTANLNRELAREALNVGASDYVLKPFDFAKIEASIISCTTRRQQEPWWKRSTNT